MNIVDNTDTLLKEALATLAAVCRDMGYTFSFRPGKNGWHYWLSRKIQVGKGFDLRYKVIVASHEIGHALDVQFDPPQLEELVMMAKFNKNYTIGKKYYDREVEAWKIGRRLLQQIGVYKLVREEFEDFRSQCLLGYYRRHQRAKERGSDQPNDQRLCKEMEKVRGIQRKLSGHQG